MESLAVRQQAQLNILRRTVGVSVLKIHEKSTINSCKIFWVLFVSCIF